MDPDNNIVKTTFKWILKASMEGIDLNKNYGCYDNKCLESTYYIDEMLDFIEDFNKSVKICNVKHQSINEYQITFLCDTEFLTKNKQKIINFKTGRFKTYLIAGANMS